MLGAADGATWRGPDATSCVCDGINGMVLERVLWVGWDYNVFGPHGGRPLLEFVGDLAFTYGSTA